VTVVADVGLPPGGTRRQLILTDGTISVGDQIGEELEHGDDD
jgi:hypothetical protein